MDAQSRWTDDRLDDLAATLRRDYDALREDFRVFRTEMRGDFTAFRTEIRGEFTAFRTEMRNELRELQRWQLRLSAVTLLAIMTVAVEVALR